ncbi:unnamed protein product [Cylicocyclus nassatus]|uniref:Uncharacterized protein n=1 Tax=Cylicocyclus nassatus TaxID=53992 RepID=A0AA36M587_CYLNA|nr:unnamed protein product [Cylicocyclus nassatus]
MASLFFNVRQQRQRNVRYERLHPSSVFQQNDRIFYSKYRFRREDVKKIVRMLEPLLPDAGLEPWEISKEDQLSFGVCQKAVSDVVTRVMDALNHPTIEARFLRFWPSDERWCLRRSQEFARSRDSQMSLDVSMAVSSESSALSTSATTTTNERLVAQSKPASTSIR